MPFKVLTRTVGDWEDCWTVDGVPMRFDTREEAEEEIEEVLGDVYESVTRGDMDSEYDRDDYKIVEVKDGE